MSHVLILVGSRQEGLNTALAEAATTFLTGAGHSVTQYPSLAQLPHYHPGLDGDGVDAHIDDFRAAVQATDAVLFVTPEYNGGPSSLIKNAMDAASRPRLEGVIHEKRCAVIGASPSPGGAAGGREGLQEGLRRSGAQPSETSFGVASAHEKIGEGGYGDDVLEPLYVFLSEMVSVGDERPGR